MTHEKAHYRRFKLEWQTGAPKSPFCRLCIKLTEANRYLNHWNKPLPSIIFWNSGSMDNLRNPNAPTGPTWYEFVIGAGRMLIRVTLADLKEFINFLGAMSTARLY